jgi:hypothetical protein
MVRVTHRSECSTDVRSPQKSKPSRGPTGTFALIGHGGDDGVETMYMETMGPRTHDPLLAICPVRTAANDCEPLRLIGAAFRTLANACERRRAIPRCYRGAADNQCRRYLFHVRT